MVGDVGFLQCPYCKYCFEGISVNKDNVVECYKCKRRFNKNKLKMVTLKKPVVICKICETKVSLTPENLDIIGGYSYICPKCMNHVAIKFKNYILQPQTIMKLKWNKNIKKRKKKIENNLFFSLCKDKKDFLVLKIMQLMAKKEDTGFLYIREKEQKVGLVFDVEKEKYIGFLGWTENKHAILRQIFVIRDERKKGYGTKLLKFWVENFAIVQDRFSVKEDGVGQAPLIKDYLSYETEFCANRLTELAHEVHFLEREITSEKEVLGEEELIQEQEEKVITIEQRELQEMKEEFEKYESMCDRFDINPTAELCATFLEEAENHLDVEQQNADKSIGLEHVEVVIKDLRNANRIYEGLQEYCKGVE